MFRGRYEHAVDPKGRVALPVRFREVLSGRYEDERLIITRHLLDPCLVIYPRQEWTLIEERLAKQSPVDPTVALVLRLFVGPAQDIEPDKQGRFLVPTDLRRDAQVEGEVVLSGSVRFIEMWSKNNYHSHVEGARQKLSQGELQALLNKLPELGI